jgi:hypothetical protein
MGLVKRLSIDHVFLGSIFGTNQKNGDVGEGKKVKDGRASNPIAHY